MHRKLFIAAAFAADTGTDGAAPTADTAPIAKHRGGGSYSIMRGDDEVIEKLTRAEAEAFTAMAPELQNQFIVDTMSKRAQDAAGTPPAPPADDADREPTAAEADQTGKAYEVTNTGVGPRYLSAGGQNVTLVPGETRAVVLTDTDKAGAHGDFKFDKPGKSRQQVDSGADGNT